MNTPNPAAKPVTPGAKDDTFFAGFVCHKLCNSLSGSQRFYLTMLAMHERVSGTSYAHALGATLLRTVGKKGGAQ